VRSPRYGHCGTCVARCKIYSPTSHGGAQHGYREFKNGNLRADKRLHSAAYIRLSPAGAHHRYGLRSPKNRLGHVWLTAAYAHLGKLDEARAQAAELLRVDPNLATTKRSIQIHSQIFLRPEHLLHIADGLRRARLPLSSVSTLELRLQIPAAALTWPRVRIDTGRLQVGMAQGGRYQSDGGTIVDGVRRMSVRSQWIDAAGLTPAHTAASSTMKLTARSVRRRS
jgi:hypothetical protein